MGSTRRISFHLATTTQNMDTCVVANNNVLRVISKLLKVKVEDEFSGVSKVCVCSSMKTAWAMVY